MLLIVYLLSELDIINFKYFFLSAFLSSFLVSIDVIYQYTFGFNIIGFESYGHHNTSFLGDELIAGGFIQNFSFFAIFFSIYLLRNNNYYFRSVLLVIAICILAIGIVVSGNRMPFILFLFGLFLVFLFSKKLKKIALVSFLTISIILGFIMSFDKTIKNAYLTIYGQAKDIVVSAKNSSSEIILKPIVDIVMVNPGMNPELIENPENDGHKKLFFTGIETWKLHKIFGNGMKSFREDCKKIVIDQKRGVCSNHPHNYYLEILTDLGIVGFVFVIAIALMIIAFVVKNYRFLNGNNLVSLFLSATTISFVLEVFPFKSTGSIFTTNNATYIILMLAIILSHKKLLQNKNFG